MYFTEGIGLGSSKKSKYYLREFESMDEYLAYCRDNCDKTTTSSGSHNRFSEGYHLARTFDEAWQQAFDGWSGVRPQVDREVDAIREKLRDFVTPHDVRVHDIVGYEPDIDRYVSGEIECMWDDMMIESPHAGKVFTVLLDNCISASQDADEMLKRGATAVALIEAFQLFGFELEIWVETTVGTGDSDAKHSTLVRVQRAGDRVDINNIMVPLANPDYQRRLTFASQEGEPDAIRNKFGFKGSNGRGGYGWARQGAHFGKRVDASVEISLERPDGAMVHDPVKWIVTQLQAQGVLRDDD